MAISRFLLPAFFRPKPLKSCLNCVWGVVALDSWATSILGKEHFDFECSSVSVSKEWFSSHFCLWEGSRDTPQGIASACQFFERSSFPVGESEKVPLGFD